MADEKLRLAREWLLIARKDLIAARKLAAGEEPVFEMALYHCQQSAEKALKGYLLYHDQRFEKTRDLRPLVAQAGTVDDSFARLRPEAELLTPYAQTFRYPPEPKSPAHVVFEDAFAATERVYRFVLAKQPELDPERQP